VGKLENLASLVLMETMVSDAGLSELTRLQSLMSLDLSGSKVTDDGVRKLEKAIPHCKITN
jgi:hypothetical protein